MGEKGGKKKRRKRRKMMGEKEEEAEQRRKGVRFILPISRLHSSAPAMFLIRLDVFCYSVFHSLNIIFTPCLMVGAHTRV